MTWTLQNFVDGALPKISAAWLNAVDALAQKYDGIFGTSTTAAQARNALGAAASGANTDITSLNSPALGAATATTQASTDNTTKVATTAMVQGIVGNNLAFTGNNTYSKGQRGVPVALTDGTNIAVDLNASNNFTLTIAGNRTLSNPTNAVAGQSGAIIITQDGTGSRMLSYGGNWKFPGGSAPTLSTAANAVDMLTYYVVSATVVHANLLKGMA